MLRNLKDFEHYRIRATDGDIGHVADFYFEDDAWVVRHVVVETGAWLSSRKVLISPVSFGHPAWIERAFPVAITREQVRASPGIDTDPPVSRQNEEAFMGYDGDGGCWAGGGLWGEGMFPCAMAPGNAVDGLDRAGREHEPEADLLAEKKRHRNDDPHLRSCNAVTGYQLHATDGDVGNVAGFLVDDATWAIRYLVADTGPWWHGHKVLIAPSWIDRVNWSDRSVTVALGRESIRFSPRYEPVAPWDWEQDVRLYDHCGRSDRWYDRRLAERAF